MKKGFTLIELLVTVVILGLITIVSIPVVNVVMKNQEEKRYSYHEEMVKESAKAYKDLYADEFDNDHICYEVDYKALVSNNLIKEDIISCDEDNEGSLGGKVQIEKEGNGYVFKPYLTCKNTKTNKEVSNDKGNHRNDCIEVSEYFIISNVILRENNASGPLYDGSWTNQNVYMEITTNDPYMVGYKNFRYSVNNGASWVTSNSNNATITQEVNGTILIEAFDNINTEATKATTVKIDKTPPTCTSSGGNATWTNTNRTISGICSDSGSGCLGNGNVTKTYSNEINSTTESPGIVKDNAGNQTTCPATQTVRIDKTAPTCVSSGGSSSWTNSNRVLTGTCSDSGSGCTGNVSKTISTETNSTTQTPGVVKDNAGNQTTCPSNQTVRIDKTPPVLNSSSNPSNGVWTNQNIETKVKYTDSGSGLLRYEYDENAGSVKDLSKQPTSGDTTYEAVATWSAERNSAVRYRAVDVVGNVSAWSAVTYIRIDKTAPVLNSLTNSSGGAWKNENVILTAKYTDTASGLKTIQYDYNSDGTGRVDVPQPTSGTTSTFTSAGTWSADRNSNVRYRAIDVAGNVSAWSSATAVKIDKTAPSCSVSGGSSTWYNVNRTITGTCSDSGSGCKGNVSRTISTEGNGNYSPGTVYDNVGNSRACGNANVRIDKTAPSYQSFTNSSGGYFTNQNVKLTATFRDTVSGLKTMQYDYNDGTARSDITQPTSGTTAAFATSGTWSAERNNYVRFRAIDVAGNTSAWYVKTAVGIDKTAPNCTSSGGSATCTTGSRTIYGTCSDGLSGCKGNVSRTINVTTNANYYPGTVYDWAGNARTCPAQRVYINKAGCGSSGGGGGGVPFEDMIK